MSEFEEYRKAKDEFFRDDPRSPLTPDQRSAFNGLAYYPESRPDRAAAGDRLASDSL
jgi:hypothetical protein